MNFHNLSHRLSIIFFVSILLLGCQGQRLSLPTALVYADVQSEPATSRSDNQSVAATKLEALPTALTSASMPARMLATQMAPTQIPATPTEVPTATHTPTSTPEPTATPEPLPTLAAASPPVRLKIARLGLDAAIESVGLTADGAMDTPTYVEDVAWYNRGPIPGEIGKAVIAGHLDAVGGVPAVFYRIGSLQAGDTIIVVHENGTETPFVVTHLTVFPYEATPFDEVFGFSLQSELNLITCTGSWNAGAQNYTNRLVVFARKVNPPLP